MYALVVTLKIKPERLDDYIREITLDAIGSRNDEPGCLRFDVIQDEADPTTIYLYEIYKDRAAFDAHLQAPHFLTYNAATKDWIASSHAGKGANISPTDAEWR